MVAYYEKGFWEVLRLKRLFVWLMEPGCLYLFPIFLIIHIAFLYHWVSNKTQINIYASVLFQIVGGALVICTINSKLNILSGSSLKKSVIDWFKRMPIRTKVVSLQANGINAKASITSAELKVIPRMETIEEQVAFLFEEMSRFEGKINDLKKEVENKIQTINVNFKSSMKSQQEQIYRLGETVDKVIVGDVKLEVLGVLCILYGVLIPAIWIT